METEEKYVIAPAPEWAKPVSNQELKLLCFDNDADIELKQSGKGLVYLKKEIVNTSNFKNERYLLDAWSISNPDILQGASIVEIFLNNYEQLVIHRALIIRGLKVKGVRYLLI